MKNFQQWFQMVPAPLRRHRLIKLIIGIFPSWRRTEVRFNKSAKVVCDLKDAWARQYFIEGMFEPDFFNIASPLIPDGGVFFDVGANFGLCSFGLFGARQEPQARFFLFEANPIVLECLEKSRELNPKGNFQLVKGCVLDVAGFSSLRFSLDHTGGGYYSGPDPDGTPNIVLDEFIEEQGIKSVDLLKMDIEGSEPLALKGAKRSLFRGIVKAVYLEMSTENLGRQGYAPSACINLLHEAGFSVFWCKPEDFVKRPDLLKSCVRVNSRHGSFTVSPFDSFPDNYQTDILALHCDTPLMSKLKTSFDSSSQDRPGIREIAI
jgi:FkbM family methyltransferase